MEHNTNVTGFKCVFEHKLIKSKRTKGQFGSWSTEHQNSLLRVSITDEYPDLVLPFSVEHGSQAYVIWCEWNSGDSFGNGINSGYEAMAAFKDETSALEYAKWLDHLDRTSDDDINLVGHPRTFVTSDGQTFSFNGYAPWEGYFERLTKIHVQTVVVGLEYTFEEDSKITFG